MNFGTIIIYNGELYSYQGMRSETAMLLKRVVSGEQIEVAKDAEYTIPQERSAEDVGNLMNQWLADPVWDLEFSDGFEAHYYGLLYFSRDTKRKWRISRTTRHTKKAEELGFPGRPDIGDLHEQLTARMNMRKLSATRILAHHFGGDDSAEIEHAVDLLVEAAAASAMIQLIEALPQLQNRSGQNDV